MSDTSYYGPSGPHTSELQLVCLCSAKRFYGSFVQLSFQFARRGGERSKVAEP
jgi:hypothetical protein